MFYVKIDAMKKLVIGIAALAFILGTGLEANAQRRGEGHQGKHKKEYAKQYRKQDKAFHKHDRYDRSSQKYYEKRDRAYHKYYEKRDREYRKYAKQKRHHYRDHDAWYYGKRFHHRSEYVYFPAYCTYYDPYRRGYVYRSHNAWVFAPTMPSFMVGLNVGALNVQFMANLPL
ncbi:hypothetical protein GCM10007415_43520 [Parapedobacter pyrenivorans]|uniref:Uncharacterized protein n=2 Tax=Parapedobacter pyrenivorans TaxID=1305674 RepID=A0A917MFF8_9SPHI|nr:hypothetical protein GCM10007415_43520 [Parapedobacter pyrenivorans]